MEPSVPSGFLHSLSLRRSSRSSGGSSMGRLLLDLLHATNTGASVAAGARLAAHVPVPAATLCTS